MKKSILNALAIGITSGLLLTGCGSQFPEMTDEEYDQIVQYSVNLLLKYSNNGVERLSSLSALEMQKQIEKENREAAKAARDAEAEAKLANADTTLEDENPEDTTDLAMTEESSETPERQPEEESTDEPSDDKADETTKEPVDDATKETTSSEQTQEDTASSEDDIDKLLEKYEDDLQEGIDNAATDASEDTDTSKDADAAEDTDEGSSVENTEQNQQPEESEPPISEDSKEGEVLTTESDVTVDGMRQELSKGIFLTYSGYSVNSSYADESEVFSITATNGNKLLILNFKLINTSGMDVTVDMVKANPHFQIVLNGKNVGYTNVTMLQNDLSSFAGTIPADTKVNMVLVKQMKADKVKTVDSLGLIGDLNGETITFNLE